MFCNKAVTTYFILVSLLRLVHAQYGPHGPARRVGTGEGSGDGGISKGSRMKYHGTAPTCSFAPYRLRSSRLFCPKCQDLIIAASESQHISTNEIRYLWVCEACGHEFRSTVRWLSSFDESEPGPATDEAEPLPAQRDLLARWTFRRGLQMR
jgi:hypothetical protein